MSRFKISVQLSLGFALAICLMSISAFIVCSQLRVMGAAYARESQAIALRSTTKTYLTALINEETGMRGFVASHDENFLGPLLEARAGIPHIKASIDAEAGAVPDAAASLAAAIRQATAVSGFFDAEIALVRANQPDQAVKNLGGGKAAFDEFRRQVSLTLDTTNVDVSAAEHAYAAAVQVVFWTVIVSTVGSVVLMTIFAVFFSRYIAGRLLRVTHGLQGIVRDDLAALLRAYDALQAGNLRADFTVRSRPIVDHGTDEIADLVRSYTELASGLSESSNHFRSTTERLRSIMGRVDEIAAAVLDTSVSAADRAGTSSATAREIVQTIEGVAAGASQQVDGISSVSSAAEELSRTAAQIASGSADQAAAVQGAGSAVNRLDAQIGSFANLGTSLASAARSANEQSAGGTAAVRDTAAAMTTLRDEAAKTERAMAKLEEKSTAVEEIVSTIDEIADQTNLLALNAAIEAARAGEHGRGFSVVADEVRKLAERAAASTRQINTILSEIRRETNATAAVVRSSVTSMEAGLALASKASDALHNVNTAIAETTRIADDVAQGATAMRSASAEVTANVSSVSAVIEENAAAAQEMQTTTELLTRAMHPISDLAAQQAAIAAQVSSSARTLASLAEGTATGAQTMKERAGQLAQTVGEFQFDTASRAPQSKPRAQTAAAVR